MLDSLIHTTSPLLVVIVGKSVREWSRIAELLAAGAVIVLAPNLEAGRRWLAHALDDKADGARPNGPMRLGELEIDLAAHRARWSNASLDLTRQELQILTVLAEEPGRAWTFADLSQRVWGGAFHEDDAALRSAIKRLRNKLRRAGVEVAIESIRGVGFRLTP